MINDDYESGAVLFFDPQIGRELGRTLLGKIAPSKLSFSSDGSVLWAADDETVYLIDPKDFVLLDQFSLFSGEGGNRISQIASSPDGHSAAVLKMDGGLHLIHK